MSLKPPVTQAQNSSVLSLEQLHVLLDHLKGIVGYFDTNHRCVYANHAYAQAYHTTPEAMIGRHIRDIIGEKGWAIVEPYAQRVLSGEHVRYMRQIDEATAHPRWIEVHLVPNASQDGQIVGNFVFIDDVTEKHLAQEAMRQSEERTQRFIEAGTEGIVFYQDGIIFDCNDAFVRMLGKKREELIGTRASHLFQKKDREFAERHMHLGNEQVYPAQLPRADGSLITVEISGRPVTVGGTSAFVASVRDTSQLASMNEALLRSQARYRSLVDNSDQCAIFTQDRKVIYANPAAQTMFQLTGTQMRGVQSLHLIHPEDRAYALKRRKELIAGDLNREVVLRAISPPAETMDEHTRIFWVRLHGSIIEWEGGTGVLIFLTDITALRESEERMRLALAREKELGDLKTRFVSMASHEFRTPLATLQTSSELLLHYNDRLSSEERNDALHDIQRAVQRMQAMMESFLAFGRIDAAGSSFTPKPVKLLESLQGLMQESRAVQQRDQEVTMQWEPPISADTRLQLDEILLSQMLINLVVNACKYSAAEQAVAVHVSKQSDAEQNEWLCISVRDQGIGIPEEDLPRLFESLHRASNVGSVPGTGLGLAIVDRAVRAHGGSVQVKSQLGQGSEFTLKLPWVSAD